IHAAGNPHFLVDPVNAKIVAAHIADAFGKLDAKSAEKFQANLKIFTEALYVKMVQWQEKLASFKGQQLVAYHNSWLYFAERFGLKIELFLEPKPGIPPSPAHLTSLVQKMREQSVRAILVDAYLNRRHAESLASKTGATAVPVTQYPGGVKGTEGGYVQLMDYLVKEIAQALSNQPPK